jgi:hypothetical protein
VPRFAQHAGYNVTAQYDQDVIQMNGVRRGASGRIQREPPNVVSMIEEPGSAAGDLEIPLQQETTMLKTISAALLAVSVLAAPALAAGPGKTADAPLIKTTQTKDTQAKTTPAATTPAKASVLKANAKMGKHHRKHLSYHHRHHKMTAFNSHSKTKLKTSPKVSMKPAAPATKRG